MKKFLLMDGSSMFYRAFYALPALTAPSGELTNAVHGFALMFLKLYEEFRPETLAIALDVGKKTFRNELFVEYKGTRLQAPSELSAQFPMLDEFAAALGIKTVGVENFEADDIIGTLSTQAADQGFEVLIATGDRDALQLLAPNVKVILLKNSSSLNVYDVDRFVQEYGFKPAQLVDCKGLGGDKVDNIPGVRGIGDKTAKDLIQRFGSVENIFHKINAVKQPALKKKLVAGEESARLSKQLALIDRFVPNVDFDPDSFTLKIDLQRVDEFCNRLDLKLIRKKIYRLLDETEEPVEKLPPFALEPPFVFNLKQIYREHIPLDSTELFDVELMNYLLAPGTALSLRPSLSAVGERLLEKIRAENLLELYERIELPLVEVLARMEERGVFVNVERLDQKANEMSARLASLEQNIFEIAGFAFNLNSSKQLAEVLFERIGLTPIKKTKTGFSTDSEVLAELRGDHPIVEELIGYRALSKLKSTFIDGIKPLIDPKTDRVHTHFNQTVTATGRLSSSDPNLQNIPVRTQEGREIRSLFEAGAGFDWLLSADYSQIELRLLAHMSGDENLIDAFNRNQDIHARTASEVFGIPLDLVTPELRRKAKAVNFGIVYGLSDYGLARDLHISRKEGAEYIARYFERYRGVKEYLDETIVSARSRGYVSTLFGRKRSLPSINDTNFNRRALAERMAMNTPIQGTAADIIKLAMIETEKNLAGLESRMILQVHDELVIETKANELEAVKRIVRDAMEKAAQLKVPLRVDVGIGKNWAETK